MPRKDRAQQPAAIRRADQLRLRYIHGGLATYLPGETFGPRVLPDFEFVWIISGQVRYEADGAQYPAGPGSMLLARPGSRERYVWDPAQTTRHAYFHFGLQSVPGDWPRPADWPVARPPAQCEVLRAMFRRVLDLGVARRSVRPGRPGRAVGRLVEAMIDAWLTPAESPDARTAVPLPEAVQRTLAWVNQQLHTRPDVPVHLPELARVGGVSPKHLCRLFEGSVGVSPVRAVRLLRLERALALLGRSSLSIKQIAWRCGFASPYHFSRCFSQAYGRSPTTARRELAQGAPPPQGPSRLTLAWEVPASV